MNPWFAKSVILVASIALVAIRAPHGQRSRQIAIVKSRKGLLEIVLLTIAWLAFFLPLIWVTTPVLNFAEYALHPLSFVAGSSCLILGLWLFHRSHADLGTNWSISLDVRENHRLITSGIYCRIRHPMYLALLIYAAGQTLVVPNYVAGPPNAVAMVLVFALRLGPEEYLHSVGTPEGVSFAA